MSDYYDDNTVSLLKAQADIRTCIPGADRSKATSYVQCPKCGAEGKHGGKQKGLCVTHTSRKNIAHCFSCGFTLNNALDATMYYRCNEDRSRYKEILRGGVKGDTARTESMLIIEKLGKYAAIRAAEVEAVRRYIEGHRQYPTIVCGDFNDTPISYTHYALSQGLTDCYAASGRGIGLSYNQKGFWVRIDHILCSSDFTPYNCQVDSEIDYSDHYPMVCWLKMRDNP